MKRLFGRTPADEFGLLRLKAVREQMPAAQHRTYRRSAVVNGKPCVRERTVEYRLTRRTINMRVGVIKRVFKWAVENELVLPHGHQALAAVSGLKEGRTAAVKRPPGGTRLRRPGRWRSDT